MEISTLSDLRPKPFLRWAGGKNWLISRFGSALSQVEFNNYHEFFLGGGSLFFSLNIEGKCYLSDINNELIETYETVRDDVDTVISELKNFKNNENSYYKIRDSKFRSKAKKGAKFIYLNQTSFNGIYRVNLTGKYNVPFGFRKKNFLDEENLRLAHNKLKNAILNKCDFETALKNVKKGDLVFLDPPYTVSHNNNGFIKYNQKLFSIDDQYRLAECIRAIKSKGGIYILTNAAHKKIDEVFGSIDDKIEISRASLIGGINASRGKVSEYIFSNIPSLISKINCNGKTKKINSRRP